MTFKSGDSLMGLVHRASLVADRVFAGHPELGGLTPSQFLVLAAIGSAKGVDQTAIDEATGLGEAVVAHALRELHTQSLISVSRAKEGSPHAAVELTPSGLQRFYDAVPVARGIDALLNDAIAPHKREEALECLRRLAASSINTAIRH